MSDKSEALRFEAKTVSGLMVQLAENDIDSDSFAVMSDLGENGTEHECDLPITETALRASAVIDQLLAALEEKVQRIAKLKLHRSVVKCCDEISDELITELYRRNADLEQRLQQPIRQQHAEWSDATFGKVGPIGPLKHLSKEALEAAAKPDDLSEWADMQFLHWDAQRRAGITDEQINQAMVEKLAINKTRSWPEPKDGEPRLHIKGES